MEYLAILLAILPGLLISRYIYIKDGERREPMVLLVLSFLWGVFSTIPAMKLEQWGAELQLEDSENLLDTALFTFGVIAFSEELVKFIFLRFFIYYRRSFDEPIDGIVYAVMVGMGFATLENILYVRGEGIQTGIIRMFTAVPAHAAFSVVMGYYIGLARFDYTRRHTLFLKSILSAIFLHGLYDFFLFQKSHEGLSIIAVLTLFVSIRVSLRLLQLQRTDHRYHIRRDFSDAYNDEP